MKTFLINFFFAPLLKIPVVLKAMFLTKKGFVLIPMAVTLPIVINLTASLKVLFALMLLDFVTGIAASKIEKQKAEEENPELKKERLISSDKLKKSGVKFFLYASTILLAYHIEKIFFIKSFSLSFSTAHITITVVVVAFWMVVELYSTVFENFKRMGFDVVERAMSIIKNYKSTKNKINE